LKYGSENTNDETKITNILKTQMVKSIIKTQNLKNSARYEKGQKHKTKKILKSQMMNLVSEMIQKGQKHKNKDSKNTKR